MPDEAQPKPSREDPDRDLVHRSRDGDYDAFEQLVRKYERGIYTLGWRMLQRPEDAEEVVQDTFLAVLEHLRDFQRAVIVSHLAGAHRDGSSTMRWERWMRNTARCLCCGTSKAFPPRRRQTCWV